MKMRRRDHEMSREFAEKILDECEWAVIAMLNAEGNPHCIPITIAREGDAIYFHSGKRRKSGMYAGESQDLLDLCGLFQPAGAYVYC